MVEHLPALTLQGAISMDIYQPIVITEQIRESFKPTRLYIKELAGIKYFGKSVKENISSYRGSGKIWKDRIKKYGPANVKTIWISEWFNEPEHLVDFALLFSEIYDIVNSNEWANHKPENGLDGGFTSNAFNAPDAIIKRSRTQLGVSCPQRGRKGKPSKLKGVPKSEDTKQKMRKPKSPEHKAKLQLILAEVRSRRNFN
jgi:hypothetical protein